MKPKLLWLLAFLPFIACKQPGADKVPVKAISAKPSTTHINRKRDSDTLQITTRCAVAISLDIEQLDNLRRKQGDEVYYTAADDGVFYSAMADSVLEAKHMPIIRNKKQKYLRFYYGGVARLIKLDTLKQVFNYYYFDPAKAPIEVGLADAEVEYDEYFGK